MLLWDKGRYGEQRGLASGPALYEVISILWIFSLVALFLVPLSYIPNYEYSPAAPAPSAAALYAQDIPPEI